MAYTQVLAASTSQTAALGSTMPILMIIIIGVVIYMAYKKKKSNKEANPFLSNRKNKDEVWKTIKQFLKDNGEKGKELADSYVVKRNHMDHIDPNSSNLDKKNKQAELKIRKWQREQINAKTKDKNKKLKTAPVKDVFVVIFKTKDSKTGKCDLPRAIECEVINTKIDKKQYDRKIVINGELDYDQEMEWIAPIKAAEEAKAAAMEKKLAKQREAKAASEKKKLEKAEKKAQKQNAKLSKK